MPKILYNTMPDFYPVCLHADCPQAHTCLHQLAYAPQLKQKETLTLLNPNLCTKDNSCKYYRSNETQRYARGFASFQSKMLPGQWADFINILRQKWGRTRFYERRRGKIAMPPVEQEYVLQALKQAGVSATYDFDSYEDLLTWYD